MLHAASSVNAAAYSVASPAHRDRHVVAAVLAFGADASRHPPHGGVIEEDGFRQRLQDVDREVVTPDVRDLVRQDGFHLARRQSRERGDWQQDDRPQPADDGRRGHARGIDDREGATETEAPGDVLRQRLPSGDRLQTCDRRDAAGHASNPQPGA